MLSIYDRFITSTTSGEVIADAEVTVNIAGGGLASLYEDSAGTIPVDNPFPAPTGRAQFYLAAGRYNISATNGVDSVSFPDVLVGKEFRTDFEDGTVSQPSITFTSDTDTGFFRKAANIIALATAGVERLVATAAGRIGIGIASPTARFHVAVANDETCGIRSACRWTGSTATPYTNNDTTLFETFNTIESNSTNYSWSVSAPNAYNDIPAGVTDSGFRIGVYGWAVSTPVTDYEHAGTLDLQIGVRGNAGFLGPGTPATAVINNAIGVRGEIYSDSAGATIETAVAGEFITVNPTGEITDNYAVRAIAQNGTDSNWSFHGDGGEFFNQDPAYFGSKFTEKSCAVTARGAENNVEFGFPDVGYGSYLGAMPSSGNPFIAFCASVDAATDTFTTAGQLAFVIENNLGADSLIFSRITNTSGAGLTPSECFRIDQNGRVQFQATPILKDFAPASASATGQTGQISFDADYIYICTGTNQWKRAAISTW